MPPPRYVSPVEALRIVTSERPSPEVVTLGVEETRGLYLAESVASLPPGGTFPDDPPAVRRARHDGYAVSRPVERGEELEVIARPGDEVAGGGLRRGTAARVEPGDALSPEVWGVLELAGATVIGSDRVRVERPLEDEEGISGGRAGAAALRIEAGVPIGSRLRAFLLARGTESIEVYRRLRVAVASVGDELTDLRLPPARRGARRDVTSFWLAEELEEESVDVVPLGIVGDEPAELRRILLRVRQRDVDVVVLSGGIGKGISDRTAEALATMESRIYFEGVRIETASSFLFAKHGGLEVFGIGGTPLAASAAWDLWLRPALRARQGAAPDLWDWSRDRRVLERADPPPLDDRWRLLAVTEGSAEPPAVAAREPESWFSPWVAGARGWALLPPRGEPEDRAYVVSALTASGRSL